MLAAVSNLNTGGLFDTGALCGDLFCILPGFKTWVQANGVTLHGELTQQGFQPGRGNVVAGVKQPAFKSLGLGVNMKMVGGLYAHV